MSKMKMLEQGSYSSINEIVPYPDFQIDFTSTDKRTVIVNCPDNRDMQDVIEFVKRERGGDWMAGLWMSEGGDANPFMNGLGLWCYLVRRA